MHTIGTADHLDPLEMLRERAPFPFDDADVQRVRKARRDELLAAERVLPGVEQWLDDARALGLGLAVASSSGRDWVESHLHRLGLRERFSHLVCFDGTGRSKPAPDLYLRACRELGVEPRDAIAVEDSPNGVTAAKAAGLWCVAVPNTLTRALPLGHADVVVGSLADLSLREAIARATLSG